MSNILWEPFKGDIEEGFRGFVKYKKRGHKYWVGCPIGEQIIADVWDYKECRWSKIDIPVDSIEAGKIWCETVEATGAY